MGPRDVSESWEVGRSRCLGALVNSAQEPPAKGPVGLGLELPPTGFGRSPGEGKGYPLQYFGLENSMDYSPWGHKESDMTEQLSLHFTNYKVTMFIIFKEIKNQG